VLVDGSLRNAHWYLEYFRNLRDKFPIIKIAILVSTHLDILKTLLLSPTTLQLTRTSTNAPPYQHCISFTTFSR